MNNRKKYFRVCSISSISAGLLFLIHNIFLFFPQFPPTENMEIQKWLLDWRFHIAMSNEFLFFATVSLIPLVIGLFKILII